MKLRWITLLCFVLFLLGYLIGAMRVIALINSGAVKVPCIEETQ